VFTTAIGTPIDPSNLRRAVRALGAKVGVPDLSPNELRHTAATLLIESGSQPLQVSDLLGHNNGRMVEQVYRHKTSPVVDLTADQERMAKDLRE
jgi:integrase